MSHDAVGDEERRVYFPSRTSTLLWLFLSIGVTIVFGYVYLTSIYRWHNASQDPLMMIGFSLLLIISWIFFLLCLTGRVEVDPVYISRYSLFGCRTLAISRVIDVSKSSGGPSMLLCISTRVDRIYLQEGIYNKEVLEEIASYVSKHR